MTVIRLLMMGIVIASLVTFELHGSQFPICRSWTLLRESDLPVQQAFDQVIMSSPSAQYMAATWGSAVPMEIVEYSLCPNVYLVYWYARPLFGFSPSVAILNLDQKTGYNLQDLRELDEPHRSCEDTLQALIIDQLRNGCPEPIDEATFWQFVSLYTSCRYPSYSIKVVYRRPSDIFDLCCYQNISDTDFRKIFAHDRVPKTYSWYQPFIVPDISALPNFVSLTSPEDLNKSLSVWKTWVAPTELHAPVTEFTDTLITAEFDILIADLQEPEAVWRCIMGFSPDLSSFWFDRTVLCTYVR